MRQKYVESENEYEKDELLRDYAFFVRPDQATGPSEPIVAQKVTELEAEVAHLKAQLGKAKAVNDTMWENIVKKVILPKSSEDGSADNGMEVDETNS